MELRLTALLLLAAAVAVAAIPNPSWAYSEEYVDEQLPEETGFAAMRPPWEQQESVLAESDEEYLQQQPPPDNPFFIMEQADMQRTCTPRRLLSLNVWYDHLDIDFCPKIRPACDEVRFELRRSRTDIRFNICKRVGG